MRIFNIRLVLAASAFALSLIPHHADAAGLGDAIRILVRHLENPS